MRYRKIPLEEQLQSVADRLCVHPEYAPCAIRSWGATPLAAYFGSTEKGKVLCGELMRLLCLPSGREWSLAYCDAAVCIQQLAQEDRDSAETAVRMLAEPLADGYVAWKKAWEEAAGNAEDTD